MYHIIKDIEAGEIDDRDKIRLAAGTMLPSAETYCGLSLPLENRQYIERLGGQSADALCCNECLASLMLIGD